jgi:hypothetical protein
MKWRFSASAMRAADQLTHFDGDLVALNHNDSARNRHIIGQNLDFILVSGIKLDHSAATHAQKLVDWHD